MWLKKLILVWTGCRNRKEHKVRLLLKLKNRKKNSQSSRRMPHLRSRKRMPSQPSNTSRHIVHCWIRVSKTASSSGTIRPHYHSHLRRTLCYRPRHLSWRSRGPFWQGASQIGDSWIWPTLWHRSMLQAGLPLTKSHYFPSTQASRPFKKSRISSPASRISSHSIPRFPTKANRKLRDCSSSSISRVYMRKAWLMLPQKTFKCRRCLYGQWTAIRKMHNRSKLRFHRVTRINLWRPSNRYIGEAELSARSAILCHRS